MRICYRLIAFTFTVSLMGCTVGWGLIEPGLPKCVRASTQAGSLTFPTPAGAVTVSGEDVQYASTSDEYCPDDPLYAPQPQIDTEGP